MNDHEKSDGLVLPAKLPNNAGFPAAEVVEGRRSAKVGTALSGGPPRRSQRAR